mgnify:CR=1 FL=1
MRTFTEYLNENVHEYMKQVKSMDLMIVEDLVELLVFVKNPFF